MACVAVACLLLGGCLGGEVREEEAPTATADSPEIRLRERCTTLLKDVHKWCRSRSLAKDQAQNQMRCLSARAALAKECGT